MGDAKKALEYFEKDLQAMEELVLREPERTDLHVDLGISYWNAYRVCPRDEEVKWLRKAKKLLEPLRSAGMVHGQIERLWQLVVDALEMRKTQ